jgi:hypothetical protein
VIVTLSLAEPAFDALSVTVFVQLPALVAVNDTVFVPLSPGPSVPIVSVKPADEKQLPLTESLRRTSVASEPPVLP